MEAAFLLSPSVFRISSINLFQFEPVVCTKALQCGCTPNIKLATEMLFHIQERGREGGGERERSAVVVISFVVSQCVWVCFV